VIYNKFKCVHAQPHPFRSANRPSGAPTVFSSVIVFLVSVLPPGRPFDPSFILDWSRMPHSASSSSTVLSCLQHQHANARFFLCTSAQRFPHHSVSHQRYPLCDPISAGAIISGKMQMLRLTGYISQSFPSLESVRILSELLSKFETIIASC
jgi:hypothetical protein